MTNVVLQDDSGVSRVYMGGRLYLVPNDSLIETADGILFIDGVPATPQPQDDNTGGVA
jgi:hypothetical protein